MTCHKNNLSAITAYYSFHSAQCFHHFHHHHSPFCHVALNYVVHCKQWCCILSFALGFIKAAGSAGHLTMRVANSGPHSGKRTATVLAKPMATPACESSEAYCMLSVNHFCVSQMPFTPNFKVFTLKTKHLATMTYKRGRPFTITA